MHSFHYYHLLERNLRARGDHPLVIDGDQRFSYREIHARAEHTAAFLATEGIGRGDRVAVHLLKSAEEVVAMFAVARLGAVFVNVNHQATLRQLEHILRDSGARALFVEQRKARELAAGPRPDLLSTVIVKGRVSPGDGMHAWDDWADRTAPADVPGIDSDLAALLYTSGSTGLPKGVMLTHRNLLEGARSVARYLENEAEDRLLSLLPFSFDYGLNQLNTMCLVGGSIVLQKVSMPVEIVRTIRRHQVTGFAAVPPTWIQVAEHLRAARVDLPSLRYITNTGGKIPDLTLDLLPEVFPACNVFLMYGLTEAFRSTYLPPQLYATKKGSIGRAIPNAEVFVINETGVCAPGEPGELVHRGSLVSAGYWGRPDATAQKIRPCPQLASLIGDEKVCFSGDIVTRDEDGLLWFVGRADSMIKTSGFRVSPTEVEDIVTDSGLVVHAVAFAVPHELLGQAIEVAIVGTPALEHVAQVLQHCRDHMPSYMVPQRLHLWAGDMPRTGSGKIDRVAVVRACTRQDGGA